MQLTTNFFRILVGYLLLVVFPLSLYAGQRGDLLNDQDLWRLVQSLGMSPPNKLDSQERRMAELGQALFFDTRLSSNQEVSCATCHKPELDFTDGRKTAKGVRVTNRNTPTLLNVFSGTWYFWDGRADNLAAQALGPLENPKEHQAHRLQVYDIIRRFYEASYEDAFGPLPDIKLANDKNGLAAKNFLSVEQWQQRFLSLQAPLRSQVNRVFANVGLALALFQKQFVAIDSPFDQFAASWTDSKRPPELSLSKAFGAAELRGLRLFTGPAQCMSCHHGPNFSDQQFHQVGFPTLAGELGRLGAKQSLEKDEFACDSVYFKGVSWIENSEACQEKAFLNSFGWFICNPLRSD